MSFMQGRTLEYCYKLFSLGEKAITKLLLLRLSINDLAPPFEQFNLNLVVMMTMALPKHTVYEIFEMKRDIHIILNVWPVNPEQNLENLYSHMFSSTHFKLKLSLQMFFMPLLVKIKRLWIDFYRCICLVVVLGLCPAWIHYWHTKCWI